jgi:hypothetical protein
MKTSYRIATISLFLTLLAVNVSAETIARVMKSSGEVFLKRLGKQIFDEAVSPGAAINNGDAIKVGSTGFAVVIFLDDRSVVKLRENTQFQFTDTKNTRSLNIEFGTILNDVKREGRTKTFRVETPVSVASVKGTKFAAVVDPSGVDQFYGQEGEFQVFNTVSGQTVTVGPGQKAISNAMGNLIQAPASPEEYPEDPAPEEMVPEEEPPVEEEIPEEMEEMEVPEEAAPEAVPEEVPEAAVEPEAPEVPAAEEAVPPEEEGPPSAPKPFGMGLGIGSVTIDGILYNQLALRPELKFGKLGIGLDVVIYIDNEGNIRKEEWDELSDIIDKFLYVRWGERSDPFWIKLGALPSVTLGYGGLLMGYSNMMEFPTVRPLGVNGGVRFGKIGTELFFANIKDFARGGTLIGIRPTFTLSKKIPLTIGANLVVDVNQFAGLKDKDGDSYPDFFDDFPDDKKIWNDTDGDGWPDPHAGLDSTRWDIDADGDNIYDPIDPVVTLKDEPFSIKDNKAQAIGIAFDVGYPVLNTKILSLLVYSEFNMLQFPEAGSPNSAFYREQRSGTGITIPGIRAQIFKLLNVSLEYRIKQGYFVPQFFDQSYDVSRVVPEYVDGETKIRTKDMLIFQKENSDVNQRGYFGSAGMDLFGLAKLSAAYANMVADTIKFRSFYASVSLNADKIPKLSEATAYYQRNNDPNPFDFGNPSENTILGYRLGYEVSAGVSLIWDFRQFYRDTGAGLEPVKQTTIETAFNF